MAKLIEVKRESITRHAKPFGYLAGGQPIRPGLHKQTEHFEAGVLGKCCKSGDSI